MNMKRRQFSASVMSAAAVAAGTTLPFAARAQAGAAGFVEGKNYARIEPAQPAQTPGKIEVLEFFSYACPHCNAFEPVLEAWVKKLPPDVMFRRVPVPFLMSFDVLQPTYYTLETLGMVDAMQMKIFAAIHVDRQMLDKPEQVAAVVAKNGGDSAKFMETYKSFSVATAVARAKKLTNDYKIQAVPEITVGGRFFVDGTMAGTNDRMPLVADALIERVRKGA
jgi:thiol:disulfide interchange protein DsbA